MQLQRANGIIPISEGNIRKSCYAKMSWGPGVKGASYRYQYNGHSFNGTFYRGPFSASNVTIYF